jgi:S-adenosylmethionine hydrolase
MRFEPSGVVTLTTDFGTRDPFVGVMKGRILSRLPAAQIIDLTHEMAAYWPAEAGFWLSRSFESFPTGTIHVAVVDPGVGTARAIAIVRAAGHVFLAPDNGLLAPLLARHPQARITRLNPDCLPRHGITAPSATFHGRDIFAPLAAELAASRCLPEDLGEEVAALMPSALQEPRREGALVQGVVITIDHFGNLITNIDAALLRDFQSPEVRAAGRGFALRRTYGEVNPGEYLALINAFQVLEIACAAGSAAAGLGLGRGAPVHVRERGKTTATSN